MAAKRWVKVFCPPADQAKLGESFELVESYDGFALLAVKPVDVAELSRSFPTEDITNRFKIRLGSRTIDTSKPRYTEQGGVRPHSAYRGVRKLSRGIHHHIVQFVGPIKKPWLTKVKRLGATLKSPCADFAYIVAADERTLKGIVALPFVRWVGHLSHRDRVEAALVRDGATLPRTKHLPNTCVAEFFTAADLKKALPQIKKLGLKVVHSDLKGRVVTIQLPQSTTQRRTKIEQISAIHGMMALRRRSLKRISNDVATELMEATEALSPTIDLSGDGETVAICDTGLDTGDVDQMHPDFDGRVVAIRSYPIQPSMAPWINNPGGNDGAADKDSGHGTHVAGSVLGSGNGSENLAGYPHVIRGLAHRASLVFQGVEQEVDWKDFADELEYGRFLLAGIPDDLTSLFTYAYNKGARIHSNSWGGGDPGEYDQQCRQLDDFVWNHKDFCVLVAAGNDGTDGDGDGKINLMSVTSPATAKNCITIGGSESLRPGFNTETYGGWWPSDYPVAPYRNGPMADDQNQVVAFSSRGPTKDGRVKPDVLAPGTFILSTRSRKLAPNNKAWAAFPHSDLYFFMGGTSMATPLAAGMVALLRQHLRRDVGIAHPSAAILKATMICSARKLSGHSSASQVMDNHQGFGAAKLDTIVASDGPAVVLFVDEPSGLETGEVDEIPVDVHSSQVPLRIVLAYSDYPGSALVNDLNLLMVSPNGTTHVANQSGGLLQLDSVNNVEVIQIASPRTGRWTARIVGSNVPHGPQDYAVVCRGHVS